MAPDPYPFFRVSRDGTIYRGQKRNLPVGDVERIGTNWVARTVAGVSFTAASQSDAAAELVRYVEQRMAS